MKQETLEEAAGSCAIKENRSSLYELGMKYFIEGAKWQQEQDKKTYSEEEVYKIWKAGQEYWKTSGASITFEEFIEQFKKK